MRIAINAAFLPADTARRRHRKALRQKLCLDQPLTNAPKTPSAGALTGVACKKYRERL
jgi:hypothetical protein